MLKALGGTAVFSSNTKQTARWRVLDARGARCADGLVSSHLSLSVVVGRRRRLGRCVWRIRPWWGACGRLVGGTHRAGLGLLLRWWRVVACPLWIAALAAVPAVSSCPLLWIRPCSIGLGWGGVEHGLRVRCMAASTAHATATD